MTDIPPTFQGGTLEAVAQHLGDALTGREITALFAERRIRSRDEPGTTKWKRLYNAFADYQNRKRDGRAILAAIEWTMEPSRWSAEGEHEKFETLRHSLNRALATTVFHVKKDGRIGRQHAKRAETPEAIARLHDTLLEEANRRQVHAEILPYVDEEVLRRGLFHAAQEAVKGLFERIRQMTAMASDGHALINSALLGESAPITIGSPTDDSDRSIQKGIAHLCQGLYAVYRNPTAHRTRHGTDTYTEAELLHLMSALTLVHLHLDRANDR